MNETKELTQVEEVKVRLLGKRVRLRLVGKNGGPFMLLGAFQKQARREGWTQKEIDAVIEDATSGDYDNLLSVLCRHCKNGGA